MSFNKNVFLAKEELRADYKKRLKKKADKDHNHADYALQENLVSLETDANQIKTEIIAARGGSADLNTRLNELESNSGGYKQVTKLGVIATAENPYAVEIPLEADSTFCKPPIEVLKFEGYPEDSGYKNVIETICDFNNADETSFEPDEEGLVVFDGKMHLKTTEEFPLTDEGELGEGRVYSLDLTEIKNSLLSGRYKEILGLQFN